MKMFVVHLAAALTMGVLPAGAEESAPRTATLYPEADTYIQNNSRDGNFGAATFLSAAGARESLIRFDLSPVSQVTSAKIRLYVSQFGTAGNTRPIVFRTIRDIGWDEMKETRNTMTHEVPFATTQSPWVGTSDPQFAGWTLATNVNVWIEADVTEAVRKAAQGAGKITFHAFSPAPDNNRAYSDYTPVTFHSRERGGTETGPQLVVEYAGVGNEAKGGFFYDAIPSDDVTLEATIRRGPGHGTGDGAKSGLLANRGVRSGLMKFDVGGSVGRFDARQVESAFLELRGTGQPNGASTNWDMMVEDAGDWSEDTIQNNALPPNVKPYTYTLPSTVPANAVRCTGYNMGSNVVTRVDVTALMKQAAARQKRHVTFAFATTHFDYWRFASTQEATSDGNRPKLVYPSPLGFNAVTATDDLTGEKPAVVLSWGAAAAGATYTVDRVVPSRHETKTLATGLTATAFTDAKTWPEESVYRVTATLPNGQTAVQVVTNTVAAATKLFCDADTFVYDGQHTVRFGLEKSMVMKYAATGGATREGLFRFDLTDAPRDAKTVTLTIRATSLGLFDGNETLHLRAIDDILLDGQPWTDDHAPTWDEAFPFRANQMKASEAASEGYLHAVPCTSLGTDTPITFDVTAAVAAARAAVRSSLTFHIYLKDPERAANCGFHTKENAMGGVYAPYLLFQPKNWNTSRAVIIIR